MDDDAPAQFFVSLDEDGEIVSEQVLWVKAGWHLQVLTEDGWVDADMRHVRVVTDDPGL